MNFSPTYHEVNFDGLIGPTHNYSGLAIGNLAASTNAGATSNPRAAALQGLKKMRTLHNLGLKQGFLPPHERPHIPTLRALGFTGTDTDILQTAIKQAPEIVANIWSASPMWTANAATIAPSLDTTDRTLHLTTANLATNLHRSIEPPQTHAILQQIFANTPATLHAPLPGHPHFSDEGAANHGRICQTNNHPGLHLFVYGEDGDRYPARQSLLASRAVARLNNLNENQCLFLQQSRRALDAGAFHNDVVCVVNKNVIFLHEDTFENREQALKTIQKIAPFAHIIEASNNDVPLSDAISSYLFNSQIVTLPTDEMALVLPTEAQDNPHTKAFVDQTLSAANPIAQAIYLDVRESMKNGGGPACLRLRVLLSEQEISVIKPGFILDDAQFNWLENWVTTHYRDRLSPIDLHDPDLMLESFTALDQLAQHFNISGLYSFQN